MGRRHELWASTVGAAFDTRGLQQKGLPETTVIQLIRMHEKHPE